MTTNPSPFFVPDTTTKVADLNPPSVAAVTVPTDPESHVAEFTTSEVADAAGLMVRDVYLWVRRGWVVPTILGSGSGNRHRWSAYDMARVVAIAARLEWGMTPEAATREYDPPLPQPVPRIEF